MNNIEHTYYEDPAISTVPVSLDVSEGINFTSMNDTQTRTFSMPVVFNGLSQQSIITKQEAIVFNFSESSNIVNSLKESCFEYVENSNWAESTSQIIENLSVDIDSETKFDVIKIADNDNLEI